MHDPMVLLLDEPFSSLDVLSANILKGFIVNMSENKTIVVSTHDIALAKSLCDRGGILVEEKMCQVFNSLEITRASVQAVFELGT